MSFFWKRNTMTVKRLNQCRIPGFIRIAFWISWLLVVPEASGQGGAPIHYTIMEEEPAGTGIGDIAADAGILDLDPAMTFTLTPPPGSSPSGSNLEYFTLDTSTGRPLLLTNQSINREKICAQVLQCDIQFNIIVQPTRFFQIIKVRTKWFPQVLCCCAQLSFRCGKWNQQREVHNLDFLVTFSWAKRKFHQNQKMAQDGMKYPGIKRWEWKKFWGKKVLGWKLVFFPENRNCSKLRELLRNHMFVYFSERVGVRGQTDTHMHRGTLQSLAPSQGKEQKTTSWSISAL